MSAKQDLRIISDALATNDAAHIERVAESCYYGRGRDRSLKAAVELWKRAAELGSADAMYYLGVCRYYGDGEARDAEAAFALWESAAALGHEAARASLETLKPKEEEPQNGADGGGEENGE